MFSSFDTDEIDLQRTGAEGVKDLKHFVDYASRGIISISERVTGSVGPYDNPFEEAVAEGLRKKGWTVQPQIGASAFRIDIGVVHPDYPGKYLVGVECDGASYHSSATARDRDKVRESVLVGLGWKLIRIWSTDFWNDADHEIDRVDQEIRKLLELDHVERARKKQGEIVENEAPDENNLTLEVEDIEVTDHENNAVDWDLEHIKEEEDYPHVVQGNIVTGIARSEPLTAKNFAEISDEKANWEEGAYEIFRIDDTDLPLNPGRFYDRDYTHFILRLVKEIIEKEAPLPISELVNRIARLHGFKKSGNKIHSLVESIAKRNCNIIPEGSKKFVWPEGMLPERWIWARENKNPDSKRDVDNICMQELVAFVRKYQHSPDPVHEVRNALGHARLGSAKKERLNQAVRIAAGNELQHGYGGSE